MYKTNTYKAAVASSVLRARQTIADAARAQPSGSEPHTRVGGDLLLQSVRSPDMTTFTEMVGVRWRGRGTGMAAAALLLQVLTLVGGGGLGEAGMDTAAEARAVCNVLSWTGTYTEGREDGGYNISTDSRTYSAGQPLTGKCQLRSTLVEGVVT